MRRTIPRRKESARTSIVTSRPSLLTRTAMTVRTGERSVAPKALKSCRPMKTDPARSIAMGQAGREVAAERFDISSQSARLIAEYRRLVAARHR